MKEKMYKSDIVTSLKQLGDLLKERRRELGATQKDLAEFCDLSHTGIGHIERGQKDVKFGTLLKLSQFLGFKINFELED